MSTTSGFTFDLTRTTSFAAEHTSAVWSVHAFEVRRQLLELGLPTGRKSKTIAPPTVEYSRIDYLRALIDADGSVGWTGKGYPFIGFVTASEALAEHFCAEVERLVNVQRNAKRNTRDRIFNLTINAGPACLLATALFYEGCLALPRKLAAAESLKSWARLGEMRGRSRQRSWSQEEHEAIEGLGVAEAAVLLGRTKSSVHSHRWQLREGST